ncbi:MAG: ABC transporter [Deltaproteobacteria bacterium]|nr:MAG: ABC transporter [Deltaproteobacteria bacterium]
MSKKPLIKFENISFSYSHGSSAVLENINFEIFQNEIVCIVGPNGGGKTTLLKIMTGLLEQKSGTIEFSGISPAKNTCEFGYMPQNVHYDIFFPISVKNVVLMGLLGKRGKNSFFGWYSKKQKKHAEETLAMVGMEEYIKKPFYALSGGQKQRVLIARALVSDPDILILDEPTSNVDSETGENLIELIKNLNMEKNKTIIMVSHDISFVSDIVTTVFCVNKNLVVHPTNTLTGELIQDIYKSSMRLVRHDHRCSEKGHES